MLDLLCARTIIALYDEVVGLGLLCFFWGGGMLVLVGLLYGWLTAGAPLAELIAFYPQQAFWFLNLGGNLFFTTQAFYHLVFFGTILLVLRRRWAAALGGTVLLSASHPFTGLQLIAVLGCWSGVEFTIADKDRPPVYSPLFLAALATAHLGYYLWLLPHVSMEHRPVQRQWSLPWTLPASSLFAAYGPASLLAAAALARRLARGCGLETAHRLLLVWFAVSLMLGKHELLIKPIQPLHFTRGYVWTPLFLLGAPVLVDLLGAASRIAMARLAVPAAIVALLLLDNAVWLLAAAAHEHDAQPGRAGSR